VETEILRLLISTHPFAVLPIPVAFGVQQVRRDRSAPLAYVVNCPELGGFAYPCYDHG
jgi:hypothetical protein